MNAHDKADEDAAFRIQARRAGRAVMWALRVVAVMFLGLVLCVAGVVFTQSLSPWPWVGVPVGLSGIAVFCYGLWWGMIGRFRCLTCPVCGVRGRISKDEWAYMFHCPKCGRKGDTGIGVPQSGESTP
jgi:hypothetical protein